jgi:hypothetical protein
MEYRLAFRTTQEQHVINHDLLISLATLIWMQPGTTPATHPDPKCKKVKAQIVATPLVNGCTSAFGHCTTWTIAGNQGLSRWFVRQLRSDRWGNGLVRWSDWDAAHRRQDDRRRVGSRRLGRDLPTVISWRR